MMSLPPEILRPVAARPDADAPRLAAADWLAAHGHADAAAFVRLQVAYALRRDRPEDERRADRRRMWELLAPNLDTWIGDLRERQGEGVEFRFVRGFLETIEVRQPLAEGFGPSLHCAPLLREVECSGAGSLPAACLADFVGMPDLRTLSLALVGKPDWNTVFRLGHLLRLERLRLADAATGKNLFTADTAQQFERHRVRWLRRLPEETQGVLARIQLAQTGHTTELGPRPFPMTGDWQIRLAQALPEVGRLRLDRPGPGLLARLPKLPIPERLSLTHFDGRAARPVPDWPGLRELSVSGLAGEGGLPVGPLEWPRLPDVEHLAVERVRAGEGGPLIEPASAPTLRTLAWRDSGLTDADLARLKAMPRLREADFAGNALSAKALDFLVNRAMAELVLVRVSGSALLPAMDRHDSPRGWPVVLTGETDDPETIAARLNAHGGMSEAPGIGRMWVPNWMPAGSAANGAFLWREWDAPRTRTRSTRDPATIRLAPLSSLPPSARRWPKGGGEALQDPDDQGRVWRASDPVYEYLFVEWSPDGPLAGLRLDAMWGKDRLIPWAAVASQLARTVQAAVADALAEDADADAPPHSSGLSAFDLDVLDEATAPADPPTGPESKPEISLDIPPWGAEDLAYGALNADSDEDARPAAEPEGEDLSDFKFG